MSANAPVTRRKLVPEKLSPTQAARVLRAKASELELQVEPGSSRLHPDIWQLKADLALVAGLLADLLEEIEP